MGGRKYLRNSTRGPLEEAHEESVGWSEGKRGVNGGPLEGWVEGGVGAATELWGCILTSSSTTSRKRDSCGRTMNQSLNEIMGETEVIWKTALNFAGKSSPFSNNQFCKNHRRKFKKAGLKKNFASVSLRGAHDWENLGHGLCGARDQRKTS